MKKLKSFKVYCWTSKNPTATARARSSFPTCGTLTKLLKTSPRLPYRLRSLEFRLMARVTHLPLRPPRVGHDGQRFRDQQQKKPDRARHQTEPGSTRPQYPWSGANNFIGQRARGGSRSDGTPRQHAFYIIVKLVQRGRDDR